jgi:hypothetical protein
MICSNLSCSKEFDSKTHNQKYCSDECCRIATNKRIMDKYYEKKAIKNGAVRLCKKCKAKLSRYNSEDVCASCNKNKKNRDSLLKEIVDEISKFS